MSVGRIQIGGAAAGAMGSPFRKLLTYSNKAIGSYLLNEAGFAGLGQYLPCGAFLAINADAGATVTIQMTTDGGSTWVTLATSAVAGQVGSYVYADTAGTFRVTVAGGTMDVNIFVM